MLAAALSAGCVLTEPRQRLAELGVAYSADAFVAQAGEGDRKAVDLFLASGMPVDVKNADGVTALTNAAAGGHLSVVQLLLKRGAKTDPEKPDGLTPLTAA